MIRGQPFLLHRHFDDFDDYCADANNWDLEYRQIESGPFSSQLLMAGNGTALYGRYLERQRLLERDVDDCMDAGGRATQGAVAENSYLTTDAVAEDPMNQLLGHSMM